MAKKVAVILSGCGYLDGAEVQESVLTLYFLDRAGVEVSCFAPDQLQMHVVDHLTNEPTDEQRNVLVEAARIARGAVRKLEEAEAEIARLNERLRLALLYRGWWEELEREIAAVTGPTADTIRRVVGATMRDIEAGR